MSTTTQILFNSPALHSLKRDQLVNLCKIHSIKATGKNSELVEKLKKHAETLPKGLTLNPADSPINDESGYHVQEKDNKTSKTTERLSEQWELMENIEELKENTTNSTLSSLT